MKTFLKNQPNWTTFYYKQIIEYRLNPRNVYFEQTLATSENYERLCDLGAHGCERKESARTYLHTMVRTSEGTMFQSSKLELL